MNKIIICRTKQTPNETIGEQSRVEDDNGATIFAFISLERAWKDNAQGESCIPAGRYFYKKCLGTDKIPYEHLVLDEVPGHSGICVHALNEYFQSKGCIGVGKKLFDINKDGEPDITYSRETLSELLSHIPEEGIIIVVEKF